MAPPASMAWLSPPPAWHGALDADSCGTPPEPEQHVHVEPELPAAGEHEKEEGVEGAAAGERTWDAWEDDRYSVRS